MPEEKRPSPWIEAYHSSLFKLLGIYEEWSRSYGINLYEYVILSYIYDHQERCSHKDIIRERLMPARLVDSVLKQFEQWGRESAGYILAKNHMVTKRRLL